MKIYRKIFLIVCYISLVSVQDLVCQSIKGDLKIGWGQADISPSRPTLIAGGSSARVFDEVNDPITSTVLVIESVQNGKTKDYVIMISVDLVASSDYLKDEIINKVNKVLPELLKDKFVMNATHTHAAPETRLAPDRQELMRKYDINLALEWASYGVDLEGYVMSPIEYVGFASDRIANAVISAWRGRKPGGLSYGLTYAKIGHNRATSYFDGHSRMYGSTDDFEFSHMEGYEDHSLNLLCTWDEKSNLTGVVINTSLTAQVEYGPKVSADFWYEARLELRKRLGEGLYIFPQVSAAGDMAPNVLVEPRAYKRMLELTGRTHREQIGIDITEAIINILPVLKSNIEWSPVFSHQTDKIELARRHIKYDDIYVAKGTWHKPEVETIPEAIERLSAIYKSEEKKLIDNPELKNEKNWFVPISAAYWRLARAAGLFEKYEMERSDPTVAAEIHAIRIGDMVFITNPFELYVDFGMQLKARSNAVQTFVVELAGPGTYLPTHRAVSGGDYGALPQSNIVGPEGGRQLVNQSLHLIEKLWSE